MKHTYQIEGMTCKGCLRSVKSALNEVPDVINVAIDLEASTATIEMQNHIPIDKFEEAVQQKKSKYHIHPVKPDGIKTRTYPINGMTCNGCKSQKRNRNLKAKGRELSIARCIVKATQPTIRRVIVQSAEWIWLRK